MKSPAVNTVASSLNEEDEWTAFGDTCTCDCHVAGEADSSKRTPLQACFPATSLRPVTHFTSSGSTGQKDSGLRCNLQKYSIKVVIIMYVYVRFWENLRSHSLRPPTVGQNDVILSNFRAASLRSAMMSSRHASSQQALDLPVDSEPFDWQHEVREMVPPATFVRPGKPESPVDINFDHSQAAFGKSHVHVLSV